jgi:hypothetical protein
MYNSLTQKKINGLIILLVIMTLLLTSVALFYKPVSAASEVTSSCGPWNDTGLCCETLWFGKQTHQSRTCVDSSTGWVIVYTEYRCKAISLCPYR